MDKADTDPTDSGYHYLKIGIIAFVAGILLASLTGLGLVSQLMLSPLPSTMDAVVPALRLLFLLSVPLFLFQLFLFPVVGFVLATAKGIRNPATVALLGLFLGSVCILLHMFLVDNDGHVTSFRRAATQAAPIVAAIEQYEKDRGRPPAGLGALVPEYIGAIPGTTLFAFPDFDYRVETSGDGYRWALFVIIYWSAESDFLRYAPAVVQDPGDGLPPGWDFAGEVFEQSVIARDS